MNSTQPLISVILPCYNAMPYLPLALESIMNQSYTHLEILCINDGSKDKTPEVLEEYAKKDKRIRVIHNESNLKLIGTLNKAISLANGELIARMDADDISFPERIEKLLALLLQKNVDVVSCNSVNIDDLGGNISKGFIKAITPIEIQFSSYLFTPIGHPSLLAKKSIFKKFNYSTDGNALHTEDYELWTRLTRNGVAFSNIDEVLYSYRYTDSGISRKFEDIQIANFIKSAKIHQELLLNKELDEAVVAVAVNRISQVNIEIVKKGLQLIDELFEKFISENKVSQGERKSLLLIVAMQKTDVLVQAMKKGDLKIKIYVFSQLLKLLVGNIFNKKYKFYLKLKF